jgi:hypothetical protein
MKELCPREDAPLPEVPTQVGLPESLKKPARVPEVIPMSGVPTKVRSSDTWKFRRRSELPTDLIKNLVQIWPFGF